MSERPSTPARSPLPDLTADERRAFERNLPKYYLFVLVSELQLWFPIWVAFLIIKRDLSLTEIAVLDAPFWLLVVFAEVPTGAVADRWGRSTSLWIGAFVYAAALLAFTLAPTLGWIMAAYVVWAIALTFTSGADSALLFDTLKVLGREDEYEKVAGRGMAMRSAAVLIAVIFGAPLAEATSLQTPFFAGIGFLVAGGVVALSFREPPRLDSGPQLSYVEGVREAARTVWRIPSIRTLVPFAAVVMAGSMATEYLTQPFLLSHGIEIGFGFSALQVPIRVTGVVGALLAFWFIARWGEVRVLLAIPFAAILAYGGLALWDALGAIGFMAAIGLLRSASFPVVTGYINRRVPSDQRATVLSLNQMAFSVLLAMLVPALGATADSVDLPTAFGASAVVLAVLAGVTGFFWARAHGAEQDRRPAEPVLDAIAQAKGQRPGITATPAVAPHLAPNE